MTVTNGLCIHWLLILFYFFFNFLRFIPPFKCVQGGQSRGKRLQPRNAHLYNSLHSTVCLSVLVMYAFVKIILFWNLNLNEKTFFEIHIIKFGNKPTFFFLMDSQLPLYNKAYNNIKYLYSNIRSSGCHLFLNISTLLLHICTKLFSIM